MAKGENINEFLNELSALCGRYRVWVTPRDADGELRIVSHDTELPVYICQDTEKYEIKAPTE